MKKLSITFKIILIFLIPAIALVYFSWYFVEAKYENLQESAKHKLVTKLTLNLSKLVHNIQIERGLGAGYLIAKDKLKIKSELELQFIKTDTIYDDVISLINSDSNIKDMIVKEIGHKNKPIIKEVIYLFGNIQGIRNNILNISISFDDEIKYYTKINKNLTEAMDSFIFILQQQNKDSNAFSKLQNLKEYAGQERAYAYYTLLSNKLNYIYTKQVKQLQILQEIQEKEFLLNSSINSTLIYTKILNKDVIKKIKSLRYKILNNKLNSSNALEWFRESTKRIDMLEVISNKILNSYTKNAIQAHKRALNSLYLTAILWILSLLSLSILTYILRNLIKNEELYTRELRIASYTFDSHEAMVITDANGKILKVNNGFTRITGYMPEEVIGKNPNILKSGKHDNEFFKEMWREIHTNGRWSSDIYNKRKNGEIYLEKLSITAIKDEDDLTTHYIAQFLDISDLKKAQEDAQHQADHDFLTGLANRKQLMQRLSEEFIKAKRHDFLHAFLFIDLDDFKKINDTYGHAIGDSLIKEVANRLRSLLREEDMIARISGDEFAVLILNINKDYAEAAKDVKSICSNILTKMAEPFLLNEYKLYITSSIGIKLFPDGEKDINDVVIYADTAMYQAKNQGKNQFVFFDKLIEFELKQLTLLEDEIKYGFKNSEFKLFFQPKVDVKSGKINGAELLARWVHPSKGILFPGSFIKTAHNLGLSHNFTILALNCACSFIKKNSNIFSDTLAINISSKELLHPEFEKEVTDTISQFGINPSQIELEITEDALVKDFELAITKITKLQEYGVKFAIDDFGTGYSSIKYLKQLPVNTLKIDRSFLQDINNESNAKLVTMIIKIAKTFNMSVVAEGIESDSQLEFIQKQKTDLYQGFHFSKAINEDSFITLLKKENSY